MNTKLNKSMIRKLIVCKYLSAVIETIQQHVLHDLSKIMTDTSFQNLHGQKKWELSTQIARGYAAYIPEEMEAKYRAWSSAFAQDVLTGLCQRKNCKIPRTIPNPRQLSSQVF